MAKKNEAGEKTSKSSKTPKQPKPPKPPRPEQGEEIIEPENIEAVEDGVGGGDEPDVHIEVDIDEDRFFGRDGPFGPDGPFGDTGLFGKKGVFGPEGPFGPQGPFGPGGVFAKSAKMRHGPRGFERHSERRGHRRSHGERRSRTFGPGELRLVLLAMLAEEPRHGYELIKALEELTEGAYSPSPGTIYPTLQLLRDEGAIAEQESEDSRKLYKATEAGISELDERKDAIEDLWKRLRRKARRAQPMGGSPELFRSLGNLASVLTNKARRGELKGVDKEKIVDLIDELARRIERL